MQSKLGSETHSRSSRCPFMRMLFLLVSMLPSAASLSTPSPPLCPKGAPTTLAAATRMATRTVPAACGTACRRHAPAAMCHEPGWIGQPASPAHSPEGDGKVLILGAGWMGSRLALELHSQGRGVHVTNRPGTDRRDKDPYFRPVELPAAVSSSRFDLLAPETWGDLPDPAGLAAVVVTFPVSLPMSERFYEAYLKDMRGSVLCYSSTSVYQVDTPGQRVDEATTLRPSSRALAESFLQQRGATVLTLSGIFSEASGPRGVCSCLSGYLASRAPARPTKQINLVHEKDIIDATCACLQEARPGERFNVAGRHVTLQDLLGHCNCGEDCAAVEDDAEGAASDLSSKLVVSQRLLDEVMPPGFSFQPIVPHADPQSAPAPDEGLALGEAYQSAIAKALAEEYEEHPKGGLALEEAYAAAIAKELAV